MPLTPVAVEPRSVRSVHDGGFFAEEFACKEPRTPESNRILVDGLRLDPIRPVFVSPKSSYLQVCSDAGLSACDWMARHARIFHERDHFKQQVTPHAAVAKPKTFIPIKEWASRREDGQQPPAAPFVRRRINVT